MSRFLLLNFKDFGLNQDITQCIQSQAFVCICCLEKNVPFVSLSSCKHSQFLYSFALPTLVSSMNVICFQCHAVLKKIELFRKQVQEAFKMLAAKTFNPLESEAIQNINLEVTETVNIYLPPAKYSMAQIKHNSKTAIEKKPQSIQEALEKRIEEPVLPACEIKTELHDETEISNDTISVLKDSSISPVPFEKSPALTQVAMVNQEKSNTDSENHDKNMTQEKSLTKKSMTEGKVRTMKLTKEELTRVRVKEAQSDTYLKMPYKCDYCLLGFTYETNIKDHMKRKHGPTFNPLESEALQNINLEVKNENKPQSIQIGPEKQKNEPVLPACEIKTELHDEMEISNDTISVLKESSISPVPFEKSPAPTQVAMANQEKSNTDSVNHDKNMTEEKSLTKKSMTEGKVRTVKLTKEELTRGRKRKVKDPIGPPKPGDLRKLLSKTTIEGYQCLECDMFFKSSHARRNHVARCHREGLQCDHCKKRFVNKTTLKKHLRLHEGPLPREECPICHKMVRVIQLKYHIRMHQNKSHYECAECKKVYSHLSSYQAHLKYSPAHASNKAFKFPCPMCNKGYQTKEAMQDHFNYQHLGKTAHKCPTCDKPIASRHTLKRHMMRVHGEKKEKPRNHVCQICGKGFTQKKDLNQHEVVHSDDRRFSCDICRQTFKQKASLYTHRKRTHKVFPNKRVVEFMDNEPNAT